MKIFTLLALLLISSLVYAKDASDESIRQQIIQESIRSYPGNCPCPYNVMSNGRSCGRRSAYSKPGGYSPICYPTDVTDEIIEKYKFRYKK